MEIEGNEVLEKSKEFAYGEWWKVSDMLKKQEENVSETRSLINTLNMEAYSNHLQIDKQKKMINAGLENEALLKQDLEDKKRTLKQKDGEILTLQATVENLEIEMRRKNRLIEEKEQNEVIGIRMIATLKAQLATLKAQLAEEKVNGRFLQSSLEFKNRHIAFLSEGLDTQGDEIRAHLRNNEG